MKSSIGTFALRFAATVVLFAPVAAAQAQGTGQSTCKHVGYELVCNSVYYPPPPPPSPPAHTIETETTVNYDPVAEARKAQLRATDRQAPPSSSLCPPPYRMTARDGCQK